MGWTFLKGSAHINYKLVIYIVKHISLVSLILNLFTT